MMEIKQKLCFACMADTISLYFDVINDVQIRLFYQKQVPIVYEKMFFRSQKATCWFVRFADCCIQLEKFVDYL